MSLAPDQQLFEYRIERILGRGAFGIVYLAHDTLLDRPVAVKELTLTAQTDEVAFKRFLQEARAAGGLDHPHIVTVYALKVVEPTFYLVMEYLAGGSLRALLEKRGPLPVEDAVRIAADVSEGLAAAHAKDIVHRDVKPENILLTEDGRAKVGDFGIAHVPHGAGGTSLTQVGFQPGTLLYMSPEQIRGQPVDGRSDVYQVGALLYEMLTGRHYVDLKALERQARETAGSNVMLFQARLYELLAEAICERGPESVCWMRLDVPEWVGELTAAALAKGVDERPIARELGQALRQMLVERIESLLVYEHQDWPEEWPTVGRDASRISWDGVPVHLQGGGLRLHWTFQAGRGVTVPAVAHGMVFVRSVDGSVHALDARTGQQRWSFATDSFWGFSSVQNGYSGYMPVVASGAVFVASQDGHVYALDVATGQSRWTSNIKMDTGFQWIAGVVATDRLVLVATGARIYALDMETGKKCWANDEIGPLDSPAVVEGTAFATGWTGVTALDVATGRTRWSVVLWNELDAAGVSAVADGMVFVECYGRLLGLDAATGRQCRDCETQGQIWSLSVANGMAFIGSIGCVYALDTASGRQIWAFQIPHAFVPVSPAVAGEVVFAGTGPMDAISGEAPPRHLSEEDLFGLHAATGRKLWAVDTGWAAIGPSVAGGMVFVGSGDGKVYAFGR